MQPQIGGVLGGGGEATQYFIVCEHKPLFKVNSFKSGYFSCYKFMYKKQKKNACSGVPRLGESDKGSFSVLLNISNKSSYF